MTWEGFVVILISTGVFMHGICCLMIARWKAIEQLRSKILELNRGTPKTCFLLQCKIFTKFIGAKFRIIFVASEEIDRNFQDRTEKLWKCSLIEFVKFQLVVMLKCTENNHYNSSWELTTETQHELATSGVHHRNSPHHLKFIPCLCRQQLSIKFMCISIAKNNKLFDISNSFRTKMHKMIYCTCLKRCFVLSAINQKQTKPKLPF